MLDEKTLQDLYDMLEPYKDLDCGHNDFVYGYYVEWQKLDDLSYETIEMLYDYFSIEFNGMIDEACEKLRKLGVPEETAYEGGANFPIKEGYWFKPYGYDSNRQSYVDELQKIEQLVTKNKDELVRKSLILSALIFTESFVNSKIVGKINFLKAVKGTDPILKIYGVRMCG